MHYDPDSKTIYHSVTYCDTYDDGGDDDDDYDDDNDDDELYNSWSSYILRNIYKRLRFQTTIHILISMFRCHTLLSSFLAISAQRWIPIYFINSELLLNKRAVG